MEKRKPHFALERIKRLVRQGRCRVTRTALSTAAQDFGFIHPAQLSDIILSLAPADFYKAMTTYNDASVWQDVYRPMAAGIRAYVKVQIVDATTVIISFKRL